MLMWMCFTIPLHSDDCGSWLEGPFVVTRALPCLRFLVGCCFDRMLWLQWCVRLRTSCLLSSILEQFFLWIILWFLVCCGGLCLPLAYRCQITCHGWDRRLRRLLPFISSVVVFTIPF
jgi:hypothetical protein